LTVIIAARGSLLVSFVFEADRKIIVMAGRYEYMAGYCPSAFCPWKDFSKIRKTGNT
jgi:hypothetical protein